LVAPFALEVNGRAGKAYPRRLPKTRTRFECTVTAATLPLMDSLHGKRCSCHRFPKVKKWT
jgi:hypothetical protein